MRNRTFFQTLFAYLGKVTNLSYNDCVGPFLCLWVSLGWLKGHGPIQKSVLLCESRNVELPQLRMRRRRITPLFSYFGGVDKSIKSIARSRAKDRLNRTVMSYIIEFVMFNKSVCYEQCWRRGLSCFKKGVFLPLEGHVLHR